MRRSALVVLPLLALALAPLASAATTQLNLVTNASPGHSRTMGPFDAVTYAVADFDGDGKRELVDQNDNQYVYVIASTTGRVLSEFRPDYPSGWGVRPINDPVAADVDGDGRPEIVVVNSAAIVCVYAYASGTSTTSMTFTKRWCHRMDGYDANAAADAGAAVADVDGDGKKEIFSNTENTGLYAFNWDGTVRWKSSAYGGNAGPLVTDLNGDGRKEVIFFGDGGEVRARDASSGSSKWTFYASNHVWPASISVSGNAADLDGDGQKEVVFIARDAHDASNFANNHFALFVLSSTGSLKWKVQPSWGTPLSYTHPVLADINGDGKKEILAMDWNTIGHKPGAWEVVGVPHVFAYSHTGSLLWKTDTRDTWSNDDIAVADVDGDGQQEVIAIGGVGDVWYLDARTGVREASIHATDWTALRGPVVADFDGSGKLSWAVSIHDSAAGGGFVFMKTDAPCSGLFYGWNGERNCGGGSTPPPPPPPPPPTGNLTATFRPTGANEWWLQVKVQADQPLAGVDARIDGGAWKPLSLKSWGDWAGSYHAPDGSTVQFRARSAGGSEALSGCYRWTSMSAVECSGGTTPPPPPPSGTFAATFKNVRGNEWWVETDVSVSGGTLSGVDARVNGGSWVALSKQSWGSWAKSIHAAPGSTVEFRARATDGQSVTSAAYAWPPG